MIYNISVSVSRDLTAREHISLSSAIDEAVSKVVGSEYVFTGSEGRKQVSADERILREYLWLHHGCSKSCVYGDDGEMQCNNSIHGPIDFKRDTAGEIIEKLTPK